MMRYRTLAIVTLLLLIIGALPASFGWIQKAQTGPSAIAIYLTGAGYQMEGNGGPQEWYFYIRRLNDFSGSCTFRYRTVDVTTQGPSDYSPLSGTVNFGPGEGQIYIPVQISGDTVFELDERFRFEVTDLAGCVAESNFREAIIYDDDSPGAGVSAISFYRDGPEGLEGNFGVTPFNFRIDRVGDLSSPCVVNYVTRDGTAFAPEDYTARSGSYTFTPGQAQAMITVNVVAEFFFEMDESFFMDITGTTGCVARNYRTVTAWITDTDGDVPPSSCRPGIEGDSGLDAAIRVDDLVRMRRAVLGFETESHLLRACSFQQLDINGDCGDGLVNSADVTVLRQWILAGGGQRPACGPIGPPIPF